MVIRSSWSVHQRVSGTFSQGMGHVITGVQAYPTAARELWGGDFWFCWHYALDFSVSIPI